MRIRPIWIMLVLAIGAAAYFFFVEQPRHRSNLEKNARSQRLTSLIPADVTTLRIDRTDANFEFERRDGAWAMTQPVEDVASALATAPTASAVGPAMPSEA